MHNFLRKTGKIFVQVKNNHTFHFRFCGDIKMRYKYGKNRGNPNKFKQKRKMRNSDQLNLLSPNLQLTIQRRPTIYKINTYNLKDEGLRPILISEETYEHVL